NPANDLVAMVNGDRASAKLPTLRHSKGLGCMALQYISRCSDKSGCADGGTLAPPCRPPETDITEVYAANCGVELPTVGAISGRILGCGLHAGVYDFEITNATVFRGKDQTLPRWWAPAWTEDSGASSSPAAAPTPASCWRTPAGVSRRHTAASATRTPSPATPPPPKPGESPPDPLPWLRFFPCCYSSSNQ
ncbi:hypothetical protein CFC21_004150, partial [Triticum aestivum]